MNGTPLERRYRWLLLAYPRRDRSRRGEEILATLLDLSRPGQRWPRSAEAAALLTYGMRARLRLARASGGRSPFAVAAGPGLALAASLALVSVLFGELPVWGADPGLNANQFGYGPFETTGIWAYGFVLLAWSSLVAGKARASRWLSALAVLAVVASYEMARPNAWGRPSVTLLSVLVVCVIPLLLTDPAAISRSRGLRLGLLVLPLACTVVGAVAFAGARTGHPQYWDPRDVFYTGDQGLIGRLHGVVPGVCCAALIAAAVVARRTWRREVWSAATLLLAPTILVTYGGGGYGGRIYDPNWLPLFEALGLLAVVLPVQLALALRGGRQRTDTS